MSDTQKPGWLGFSIRDLMWLTAIVAVVLWALYARSDIPGRFAMEYQTGHYQTFVLDTATGRGWVRDLDGNWTDATPPALKK